MITTVICSPEEAAGDLDPVPTGRRYRIADGLDGMGCPAN